MQVQDPELSTASIVDDFDLCFDAGDKANGSLYLAVPRGADDVKGLVKPLAAMGAQTYLIILAPNSGAAFVRDIRLAGDRTPI